jgi:hypothetical protein
MTTKTIKTSMAYALIAVMLFGYIPAGACNDSATLRPRAAAHRPDIQQAVKASSAGRTELHGDARLHKTVIAQAANIEILPTGQAILRFPVSVRDANRELQRFNTIVSTIKTHLIEQPAYATQEVYLQATRILDKHITQLQDTIERKMQELAGRVDADENAAFLQQSPVNTLRDILRTDIIQYQALDNQVAAHGAAMALDLLNGEESIDEPLILYGDIHNPTAQEMAELSRRAQQEQQRFKTVLAADIERREKQVAQYYQRAEHNIGKLRAFTSTLSSLYSTQLEKLISAGIAIYSLTDIDSANPEERLTALGQIQQYKDNITAKLTALKDYSTEAGGINDVPNKGVQYKALLKNITEQANELQGVVQALELDTMLTSAFTSHTKLVYSALLGKMRHTIDVLLSLSEDINNAITSAEAAGPFIAIVQGMEDEITQGKLAAANARAETLLLQGSSYVKLKQMLQDHAAGRHTIPGGLLVSFQDTVGAIENLVYGLRAMRSRLQHPSRNATQPIALVLTRPIGLDQFTDILDRYNIAGIITTHGTLAEHQPITASGRGIPWVRVADKVDLEEMITPGQEIIIEARTTEGQSKVILELSEEDMQTALARKHLEALESVYYAQNAAGLAHAQGQTHNLGVRGNSASLEETHNAVSAGADGIGLFRSELLVSDYEQFLEPYLTELQDLHEKHHLEPTHASLRLRREMLFYHMRIDILSILQSADTARPFLFRLFDFKIGDKGDMFLNLLPENEQGSNFEDNASRARTDFMTLLVEALLDAMIVMHNNKDALKLMPMFPEVNSPEQIRWFFDTVWPAAIKNQKSRIAHELKLMSLEGSPEERLINDISSQTEFAIMAERLGINDTLEPILHEFPQITAVSVGTNDYTEDLLNVGLAHYGVKASRADQHFEKSFFELEPIVLRHILNLAKQITSINRLRDGDKIALGVCGDIAGRYEFVLFMLWLQNRYGENLPVYVSIVPDKIGDIKSFIRTVNIQTDFSIHGEPVFDSLLNADSVDASAIEVLASHGVKHVLQRYRSIPEYREMVLEPYAHYKEQLAGAQEEQASVNTATHPSSARQALPPQGILQAVFASA